MHRRPLGVSWRPEILSVTATTPELMIILTKTWIGILKL